MTNDKLDTSKTTALIQHLDTPENLRTPQWQQKLFTLLVDAPLLVGAPNVIIGPDGFSYFALLTPPENQPFTAHTIEQVLPEVLIKLGALAR